MQEKVLLTTVTGKPVGVPVSFRMTGTTYARLLERLERGDVKSMSRYIDDAVKNSLDSEEKGVKNAKQPASINV